MLTGLAALVLPLAAVSGPAVALTAPAAARTFSDGAVVAGYRVVFAGYGAVSYRATGSGPQFTLAPQAPQAPQETHSALVVSTKRFGANARYAVSVVTRPQLRTGSPPNPWETGWVVVNYADPDHFYYLALKTNGWELGKRDPAYPGGQRFLATGPTPAATIGRTDRVAIRTIGSSIQVTVNGTSVIRFTDTQNPYLGGSFGFYCEDARATFDRISTP